MTPIEAVCPCCSGRLRVRERLLLARPVACPECGQMIQIDLAADGTPHTSRVQPAAESRRSKSGPGRTSSTTAAASAGSTPNPTATSPREAPAVDPASDEPELNLDQLTPTHSTSLRWAWGAAALVAALGLGMVWFQTSRRASLSTIATHPTDQKPGPIPAKSGTPQNGSSKTSPLTAKEKSGPAASAQAANPASPGNTRKDDSNNANPKARDEHSTVASREPGLSERTATSSGDEQGPGFNLMDRNPAGRTAPTVRLPHPALAADQTGGRLTALGEKIGQFVEQQGELPRQRPVDGVSKPAASPRESWSWMAELEAAVAAANSPRRQAGLPWHDAANEPFVRRRLPSLQQPGMSELTGEDGFPATHFAGNAGVGPGARQLPLTDSRAGAFGENRKTTLSDFRDGLSQTILVYGVREQLGSWASGGTATLRELTREPYINGPDGLGTGQPDSMLVLMADGHVAQISSQIDPELLRHLATIQDGPIDLGAPLSVKQFEWLAPRETPAQPTSPSKQSLPPQLASRTGQEPPAKEHQTTEPDERNDPKRKSQIPPSDPPAVESPSDDRDSPPPPGLPPIGLKSGAMKPAATKQKPESTPEGKPAFDPPAPGLVPPALPLLPPEPKSVAQIEDSLQLLLKSYETPADLTREDLLKELSEMIGCPVVWNPEEVGPALPAMTAKLPRIRRGPSRLREILTALLEPAGLTYRCEPGQLRIVRATEIKAVPGSTKPGRESKRREVRAKPATDSPN